MPTIKPQDERTQGRMTTGIERAFRRTPDGYYREVFLHFIHFTDPKGYKSSKLDKMIPGKLWKVARPDERSMYGECEYVFPDSEDGKPTRLVCLGDK